MPARLYVGTSGFSYPEWRGRFYPADLPAEEMLRFYSRALQSVELNNTFYRFPRIAQVEQWRKITPKGFRFAMKANKTITHNRRLRDVEDLVRLQVERVEALKDRAGPLLIQLPPSLRKDVPLLRDFLYLLPPMLRSVEFRHASWYTDEVYGLLEEHHTALAIMESDEDEPVLQFVGPFVYLRLHHYTYEPSVLAAWAGRVREQLGRGLDVYAYFTHEEDTPGPAYAQELRRLVEG